MSIRRRDFLALAGAAALPAQAPPRPNVVFFMTDDHGAWSLGSYGCRGMHTPNLDQLAADGMRFTRAFACTPVCSPSRATYYTGRLPSHHGVQDFLMGEDAAGPRSRFFLEGQTTFAHVLSENGYVCGLAGKWHLGMETTPQSGFEYWCTTLRPGGTFKQPEFSVNGERITAPDYKTDFVGDCAIDFVEKNRDRPFCLVVPFFAPHTPYDYQPEKYRAPYRDSNFDCFPAEQKHPQRRRRFDRYHGDREAMTSYSALVAGVDANVGRVLAKLDELGLRENTVVVFSADQGWNAGHHGVWGKGNATIPFNMFEESIQVPLIWNHPGSIEAGSTASAMVSTYDFFPTLLDYLGVEAPHDPKRVGRSYAGFLRGEKPAWNNEVFFEYGYVRAIRTENLKYVRRTDGWGDELVDLEDDPDEVINRIGAPWYREQLQVLRERLDAFFEQAGAPPLEKWRSTTQQEIPIDSGYYNWRP